MKENNRSIISDEEMILMDNGILSQFRKSDFTIVVPVLNEEESIGLVIKNILDEGYENILIVDGYSSDGTVHVASKHGVKVIYQQGKGKTGAIKTAIDHIDTPYLIIIDGDCTYDPSEIKNFYPHIRFNDEVIGIRKNGRTNIPFLNRFGNWVINFTFNLLFSSGIKDVCSGLYALKTRFAKTLELKTQGFDVEVEIAAQTITNGSLTQIPINYHSRVGQQKLQPFRDGTQIFRSVWTLARIYNPVFLYSMLATLSIIPSLIILSWVSYEMYNGIWHPSMALFGSTILILSFMSFILCILSTLLKRQERRILKRIKEFLISTS